MPARSCSRRFQCLSPPLSPVERIGVFPNAHWPCCWYHTRRHRIPHYLLLLRTACVSCLLSPSIRSPSLGQTAGDVRESMCASIMHREGNLQRLCANVRSLVTPFVFFLFLDEKTPSFIRDSDGRAGIYVRFAGRVEPGIDRRTETCHHLLHVLQQVLHQVLLPWGERCE